MQVETTRLLGLLEGNKERVGFILNDGQIVEVENICDKPEEGFVVRTDDIAEHAERAFATWHTHPNATSQLSGADYVSFRNWPELRHFIVGTDGVSCYAVEGGAVVNV